MNNRRAAPLVLFLALGLPLVGSPRGGARAEGEPGVPDKALQEAIDQAIARGADYLRSVQKESGMIGGVAHRSGFQYEIGTTALAGLALLASGEKLGDAAVDRAMAYCKPKDLVRGAAGSRTTYDTGTLLMFVSAYYRGPQTHGKVHKRGTVTAKDKGNPCKFPEEVLEWVRQMVSWLSNAQEQSDQGGWGYPRPRADQSNTQYALLGLRAARDCGGNVPRHIFKVVAERTLALQEQDGPKVQRTIGGGKKGERVYKINAGDRARGWSYLAHPPVVTGSMTTSGIGCLAICHDALLLQERDLRGDRKRHPLYTAELENAVRRGVQDGFAWLDINFAVDKNPGKDAPNWHYYYLYGLERAAVFGGRTLIGQHDWYILGSRYLITKQNPDGSWSTGQLGKEYEPNPVADTAWAILFLKKATQPMDPIRGPVITEPESPKK